jgi:hypothetical protein
MQILPILVGSTCKKTQLGTHKKGQYILEVLEPSLSTVRLALVTEPLGKEDSFLEKVTSKTSRITETTETSKIHNKKHM